MGPAYICRTGIPGQEAEDPPGAVPGADGRPDSLAAAGGAHPSLLPQSRQGPPPLSAGGDAADSLCAAVLQPQRPRHGGLALRGRIGTAVRWPEAVAGPARRDHDSPFPPSSGAARPGPGVVRRNQRASGVAGTAAQGRDHRGRQHHRGAGVHQETGLGPGTRRCTRRRRGPNGISG